MKHFNRNLSLILVLTLIFSNILGLKTNATTDYLLNDKDIISDENTDTLLKVSTTNNSAIDLSTLTVVGSNFAKDDTIKVIVNPTNGELIPEYNNYIHMSIKYLLPNG